MSKIEPAFEPNPERYARLSVPFESDQDARNALEAFMEKVSELRESYRIAEIAVAAGVYLPCEHENGRQLVSTTGMMGDLKIGFRLAEQLRERTALALAETVAEKLLDPPEPASGSLNLK